MSVSGSDEPTVPLRIVDWQGATRYPQAEPEPRVAAREGALKEATAATDDRSPGGEGTNTVAVGDVAGGSWTPAPRPVIGNPGRFGSISPNPADREGGPHRPDMAVDLAAVANTTVAVASLRGPAHLEFRTVRQDAYALTTVNETVLVALADGVSEGKRSEVAADLACRVALRAVAGMLNSGVDALDLNWEGVVEEVRNAIRKRAANSLPPDIGGVSQEKIDYAIAAQVMSTTLEVVIVETAIEPRRFVRAALCGDGYGYLLHVEGRWESIGAGKSEDSTHVQTRVTALPQDPGPPRVVDGHLRPGQALMVCTDGVGDFLRDGDNALGQFLATAWSQPTHAADFLRALDFVMNGASDDRTVVVVW